MRPCVITVVLVITLSSLGPWCANAAEVNTEDIENLMKTLQCPGATELPRTLRADDGFMRFVGAPPGGYFINPIAGGKSSAPDVAAKQFVADHKGAFGALGEMADFTAVKVNNEANSSYVRLQQNYSGVPILGAQMAVQTDSFGGVLSLLSDILRDTSPFDTGAVKLSPTVPMADAQQVAVAWIAAQYETKADDLTAGQGTRMIYAPAVIGATGPVAVVWRIVVSGTLDTIVKEVVFVDAHSGDVVFHYSLIHPAKTRTIYDAANASEIELIISETFGTLVRTEGQPPCGIEDADDCYDYLGDTYDFYNDVHDRDSIDNKGMTLDATVRINIQNAFYYPQDSSGNDPLADRMYFGTGFVVDDVTAHELTHGVTSYESDLIYAYQSGAINESFSDIWGEYVDLTNGRGLDVASVRWLMGEDMSFGAMRNMADPTQFGDPDRVGSMYYYYGAGDDGGVHTNSGIINKLCYLLTDGDDFNGQVVLPLVPRDEDDDIGTASIEKTAQLFYEMQTNLLTSASDFEDFYMQLGQATINLGYSFEERLNVRAAAQAVEIAPADSDERILSFRAIPTKDVLGRPVISLMWANPPSENFRRVILMRSATDFPQNPSDGVEIYRGRDEKFLDVSVIAGTEYFYSLFADMTVGFPDVRMARVTAGGEPPDFLTELFESDPYAPLGERRPFDLAYTQITFTPIGPATGPLGSVQLRDYTQYETTIRRNISELPVAREDEEGRAYSVSLMDDGIVWSGTGVAPFPFFGKNYYTLYIAANGYVAFQSVETYSANNFPSQVSHFAIPRISFFFADLAPNIGGTCWLRYLDDRIVITFENMPEWEWNDTASPFKPNTLQAELFYSGHIRFTYLEVNANNVICGLSDGQGIPLDPADLFQNVQSVSLMSDFSSLSSEVTALSLEPMAPQIIEAGEEIRFTVNTRKPLGMGIPSLFAAWNGPGDVPFGDNRDGTGNFLWRTTPDDSGKFVVRFTAVSGAYSAYQDVTLMVSVAEPLPEATNLKLHSSNPIEDPARDRPVSLHSPLTAEYTYYHPWEFTVPGYYEEGSTQILWFKNNGLIPMYSNQLSVPPTATRANDQWFYTVTPWTVYWLMGEEKRSPVVTILALPEIMNVALPEDLPETINVDDLPLIGSPIASGPISGGTTVVILGKELENPISVTIGGIEVPSIAAIDGNRIEVVTPAHSASLVIAGIPIPEDMVVTTAVGSGVFRDAFAFVENGTFIDKADVNGDGIINALDVQLVVNAVLDLAKDSVDADVNRDGRINSMDIQAVVNASLRK